MPSPLGSLHLRTLLPPTPTASPRVRRRCSVSSQEDRVTSRSRTHSPSACAPSSPISLISTGKSAQVVAPTPLPTPCDTTSPDPTTYQLRFHYVVLRHLHAPTT